jgi:quercetin dioxygenase-like cupin family protein
MGDTSAQKVMSESSPTGEMGQKYLASGVNVAMRLWENEAPNDDKETRSRDYETVGYVIEGKAELHLEGQKLILEKGDSWVVPKGAEHTYVILETFTAIEATSPPAHAHGRDEE